MDKKLFSERLKKKREENFSSQYAFARAFDEKFPARRRDDAGGNESNFGGILGSVKKYESKESSTIPKLDTACNLASLLGVGVGYLTGEYKESTFDLHAVCEFTGLSEDAVKRLHALSAGKLGVTVGEIKVEHIGVISALLSSEEGLEMLNQIAFFQIYSKQNPEKKADDLTLEEYEHFYGWAEQSGKQVVQRRELCEVCLQRAAELLKDACRKMV